MSGFLILVPITMLQVILIIYLPSLPIYGPDKLQIGNGLGLTIEHIGSSTFNLDIFSIKL
jgi:hypothetical protein